MTHIRLDSGCQAKVLHVSDDEVMFTASWPAAERDKKLFNVIGGVAHNTICVSREYFEQKYGKVL